MPANALLGQNLTIWLHTIANFSADTSTVQCGQIRLRTIARYETFVHCPTTLGVKFVTVQLFSTTAMALGLQEVRIFRASECLMMAGVVANAM